MSRKIRSNKLPRAASVFFAAAKSKPRQAVKGFFKLYLVAEENSAAENQSNRSSVAPPSSKFL
jgi:hypothetical protein